MGWHIMLLHKIRFYDASHKWLGIDFWHWFIETIESSQSHKHDDVPMLFVSVSNNGLWCYVHHLAQDNAHMPSQGDWSRFCWFASRVFPEIKMMAIISTSIIVCHSNCHTPISDLGVENDKSKKCPITMDSLFMQQCQ